MFKHTQENNAAVIFRENTPPLEMVRDLKKKLNFSFVSVALVFFSVQELFS